MGLRGARDRIVLSLAVVAALGIGSALAGLGSVTAAIESPNASASPTGSGAASHRPAIPVPGSIDSTGATDASADLITFLETVPDGSTIEFKPGGTYRMDQGLKFSDRHDLTFEGSGVTLISNGDTHETSSLFALWGGNTGITIRDFNLVGNSTAPGVYQPGREGAHGVLIDGGRDVDVSGVTVSSVWGDGFYVGLWADNVYIHDSTVRSNGRNGVSIIAGKNVTVQRVAFDASGYCTFDIESNNPTEGATNIRFVDNTAGRWGNIFLAANGAAGSVVDGVTVSGNTVTGATLQTDVTLARRQNIVFVDNTSTVPARGPILRFAHVDGLTIDGNVQPLTSGALAAITDSTAVTYSGTLAPEETSPVALLLVLIVGAVAVAAAAVLIYGRMRPETPRLDG